jgi:hypothetical protein
VTCAGIVSLGQKGNADPGSEVRVIRSVATLGYGFVQVAKPDKSRVLDLR